MSRTKSPDVRVQPIHQTIMNRSLGKRRASMYGRPSTALFFRAPQCCPAILSRRTNGVRLNNSCKYYSLRCDGNAGSAYSVLA